MKYYTPVPAARLPKIEAWLQEHNYKYEVLDNDAVPDDVPQCYTFMGRKSFFGVAYIYSEIEPEKLIDIAERMMKKGKT